MRSVESQVTRLFLCHLAVAIGLASALVGLGLAVWDGFEWQHNGLLKPLYLGDITSFVSLDKQTIPVTWQESPFVLAIFGLLGSVPLEALLFVFGFLLLRSGVRSADEASRRLDLLRRLEAR